MGKQTPIKSRNQNSIRTFGSVHHGDENRHQFSGFKKEFIKRFLMNSAIVAEQFEPKLRLVGFLQGSFKL